jgi:mannose-6-phosphate isomerase-like protein (cupin superfamily)
VTVVRADSRLEGGRGNGHRYEVLTPPFPGQRAEVSLHTLAPKTATGGPDDPPMHEAGSRETAVVLAGRLTLVCEGVAHELGPGDAVTFDADLPHHLENAGRGEAQFMSVIAAGLRRS